MSEMGYLRKNNIADENQTAGKAAQQTANEGRNGHGGIISRHDAWLKEKKKSQAEQRQQQ